MKKLMFIIIAAVLLCFSGCNKDAPQKNDVLPNENDGSEIRDTTDENVEFGEFIPFN